MVGIQYEQLALHANIHILSGDSFQIIGHIKLDTNTIQAVTKNLPYRIEVPGKLVHIGRCTVTGIVKPHMRHTHMAQELAEVGRNAVPPL